MKKGIKKDIPLEERDTFLYRFVDKTISAYREPERKGIKRGDEIGYSKVKLLAAVLRGTTNWDLKQLASKLGISHFMSRQWAAEDKFKAKAEGYCSEFADILRKGIHARVDAAMKKYNEMPKPPYPELPKATIRRSDQHFKNLMKFIDENPTAASTEVDSYLEDDPVLKRSNEWFAELKQIKVKLLHDAGLVDGLKDSGLYSDCVINSIALYFSAADPMEFLELVDVLFKEHHEQMRKKIERGYLMRIIADRIADFHRDDKSPKAKADLLTTLFLAEGYIARY